MKTITLTTEQWESIRQKLVEEHGNKILISWVCRRELGFMLRPHYHERKIDFDDAASKSMFVLKYL